MSGTDFDQHFTAMGLGALPADVSVDATYRRDGTDATLASQPQPAMTDSQLSGTMPRLVLATPDAAREPAADAVELVPIAVLGEGGMGRVLLARQHSLGREVAVKVLKGNAINDGAASALVDEARTTGALEHPGVVPVYALARDGAGLPALVMKRVDGVSWRELIHDPKHAAWATVGAGRDQLEANLEILIQVCHAIAHAHRRGVIHRDVKPANVLVGELGEVYVADWGVAIQRAGLKPGPPRLIGTPAYLAPEMVTGDALLMDERTDVYLLGATLHEVLTKAPPHVGTGLREVLEQAFLGQPPKFGPDVPAELAQICATAMAADPNARYPNALALRDALRLFLVHRGSARLTAAAADRLKTLEATPDLEPRRWYALVSECRFGFVSALEAHPGDTAAAEGLARCLTYAARTELARGHVASARAFLAELKAPPPELETRLRALEEAERDRSVRDAKLAQLELDANPEVGNRQRAVMLAVLGASITLMVAVFGRTKITSTGRLIPMLVTLTVLSIVVFIGRRSLLSTKLNRQMVATVAIGCVMVEVNRLVGVLTDTPVPIGVVSDAVILGAMLFTCAVTIHVYFCVPAVVVLGGGLAALLSPEHAVPAFAASAILAFAAAALLHPLWKRATGP